MRGTQSGCSGSNEDSRIIPAYAGNTASRACSSGTERDHPRVCGEHGVDSFTAITAMGSSPRMRGTRGHGRKLAYERGIIPAYAGNTRGSAISPRFSRDHPRVCGEHPVDRIIKRANEGSSPRMRGTHIEVDLVNLRVGIIPAYAGNTRARVSTSRATGDHPRVCGEHSMTVESAASTLGSSPRMRGTLIGIWQCDALIGIIPAYAGNTMQIIVVVFGQRDHPRVCGEHCEHTHEWCACQGSSPRMRGTLRIRS